VFFAADSGSGETCQNACVIDSACAHYILDPDVGSCQMFASTPRLPAVLTAFRGEIVSGTVTSAERFSG
jgi:hypothetical protein